MSNLTTFIRATRPRTYPLALASIICGNGLAWSQLGAYQAINWLVFVLTLWVALALQILSNLANDYGDGIKGTDNLRDENSPTRMLASAQITAQQFKRLIYVWALLTFCSGVGLIAIGFDSLYDFLVFLAFGILAIIAAMAYTMGKRPYGYRAMGEVAVLVFFGWLGVLGSIYLQTNQFDISHILPATGSGGLAACVLYVNNMRDYYADKQAGKVTIAVLLGQKRMQIGYYVLLTLSLSCYLAYAFLYNMRTLIWLPLLMGIWAHIRTIYKANNQSSDTQSSKTSTVDTVSIGGELKRIVLLTLFINLFFVVGLVLSHTSLISF